MTRGSCSPPHERGAAEPRGLDRTVAASSEECRLCRFERNLGGWTPPRHPEAFPTLVDAIEFELVP